MKRVVLITGATSGFGRACAEIFAKDSKLILTGRRKDRLEELKASLNTEVLDLCFDIRDMEACEKAIANLPKDFSPVDVLINNAGLALGLEAADQARWTDWQQMIETNILGLSKMTHLLLPQMVQNGKGLIVNIGSIAGAYPYPGANVYGATKAFVSQLSKNLRSDLVAKNIKVCNIEPGLAQTEFSEVRFHGDKDKAKSVYKGTNPITATDIAETAYWVASRPTHININSIEIMANSQAWGAFQIIRED